MNEFTLVAFAIYICLVFSYFLTGITNSLFSTVSFILSLIITNIILDRVISFLFSLGWKENVYSPSLILVFLFIIIWGGLFAISSYLPSLIKNPNKFLKFFSALTTSFVSVIIVSNVICNSLPPFIPSEESQIVLKNSLMCKTCSLSLLKTNRPDSLQSDMRRAVTPQTSSDVIILSDNYTYLSNSALLEEKMFALINETRAQNGVALLVKSGDLDSLAQSYAKNIVETKRFSHVNIENQLPADRAKKMKLEFDYFGENLAIAPSVDLANEAIMKSESHRDNILSPAYRQIGLSVVSVTPNEILVVEEFSN